MMKNFLKTIIPKYAAALKLATKKLSFIQRKMSGKMSLWIKTLMTSLIGRRVCMKKKNKKAQIDMDRLENSLPNIHIQNKFEMLAYVYNVLLIAFHNL